MKWMHRLIYCAVYCVWFAFSFAGALLRLAMMVADMVLDAMGWWLTWHLDRAKFREVTCLHARKKRWQTGYGGHYLFECKNCGKTWEETR